MWPQPTELQILPNWVAFMELSIACPESVGGQVSLAESHSLEKGIFLGKLRYSG